MSETFRPPVGFLDNVFGEPNDELACKEGMVRPALLPMKHDFRGMKAEI